MTDFDADEKIPPLKRGRFGSHILTDNLLVVSGIGLALLAAFFPWYVFFNEDQFVYRPEAVITSRDLPELPARPVVIASPSAIPDSDAGQAALLVPDNLVTGAVPEDKADVKEKAADDPALDQPFPRDTRYRLLFVSNGQAMIEHASGIYLARVGAALPDDSHIATLEQRNGDWVIITDQGKVIKREPDANAE
jgi:hypothetical protein